MRKYTYEYMDIGEVCDYNELDRGEVMDAISNSDISFGTNFDTLISQGQLQEILDDNDFDIVLDFGRNDETVVISLGS